MIAMKKLIYFTRLLSSDCNRQISFLVVLRSAFAKEVSALQDEKKKLSDYYRKHRVQIEKALSSGTPFEISEGYAEALILFYFKYIRLTEVQQTSWEAWYT